MNLHGGERKSGGFVLAPEGSGCSELGCRYVDRDAFGAWAERTAEQVAFPAAPTRRSPHLKRVALALWGTLEKCEVSDGPTTEAPHPEALRELVDELATAWMSATPAEPHRGGISQE